MAAEPSARKQKRLRHFWSWVKLNRSIPKADLQRNRVLYNQLRTEHSREFPDLYSTNMSFCVKELCREFHRKVLAFNQRLREDKGFDYSSEMFDDLELHKGEISNDVSKRFEMHYFCGYKSFVRHGAKADHRNYQMCYLERAFQNFQRSLRKEKHFASKQVREEVRDKRRANRLREAEEKARQREEQVKLQREEHERLLREEMERGLEEKKQGLAEKRLLTEKKNC